MKHEMYLVREMDKLVKAKDCTKYAIYPYGRDGIIIDEFLQNRNIEHIKVDNIKRGEGIFDLSVLMNKEYMDYHIIISSGDMKWYREIRDKLYKSIEGDKDRVTDLFKMPDMVQDLHSQIGFYDGVRTGIFQAAVGDILLKNVRGNAAEAGVFQGDTARIINYLLPNRKLYLVDSFAGFCNRDVNYDSQSGYSDSEEGDYQYSDDETILNRMPYKNQCKIVKGFVPESLMEIDDTFCFVHIDMDLYIPIFEALSFFYPKMESGGYILVHDCLNPCFPGARKAVQDYCRKEKLGYGILPDGQGTAMITKP